MIKHIVTLGIGPGASGTIFIPTLGFASGEAPEPPPGGSLVYRVLFRGRRR